MSAKPWLARYCVEVCVRRFATRVSSVDGFSVATDGRSMVCVRDGGVQEYPPTEETTEGDRQSLRKYLAEPFTPVLRTDLASLWLWCGGVVWDRCTSCNGRGEIDADTLCPDCDGGRGIPTIDQKRPGFLAGIAVERSRLAWSLAPELADEPVAVGASPRTEGALYLEAASWRVVVMAVSVERWARETRLRGNPPPPETIYPTFHPEPEFARMWIEQGDPDVRLILADWLEDRDDPYAAVLRRPPEKRERKRRVRTGGNP